MVSVALQLGEADSKDVPGGRLVDKFPSTTTLWMILRKFENTGGVNLNFTGRGVAQTEHETTGAGRIYYEIPVLNIMGRELSAFSDFQKTLAQLGLNNGTGLIRLSFRKTAQPLEEAMAEIDQYFKSAELLEDSAGQPSSYAGRPPIINSKVSEVNQVNNSEGPRVGSKEPPDDVVSLSNAVPEAPVPDGITVGPNQRPISVFAAPSSPTPRAALSPHNEADYELTINQAKLYQSQLQANAQNKRLLSDLELQRQAEEKAARQEAIKALSIKVRFPDQLTILSDFTAADTAANLYEFVRGVIIAEDQPFLLIYSGPKGPQTVPNSEVRLIKDLGFSGRMLVNFSWDEHANVQARMATLKPEFASKAKELHFPNVAEVDQAADEDEVERRSRTKEKDKETSSSSSTRPRDIPKWFKKMGKK